jgi:hypothetical protein
MPYARRTRVPIDQSRLEIERVCRKYGATEFGSGWREDSASVSFVAQGRMVRFIVPMPKNNDTEQRRRWRCLLLGIKAKMECVATKIETFEQAFLAHIVVPGSNRTVYEELTGPDSKMKLLEAPRS